MFTDQQPALPGSSMSPMLRPGQVIRRMDGQLWQVVMVNDCRARIQPLVKTHVTMPDGREFDAAGHGLDIAPNAMVTVVADVKKALAEMELRKAEKALAAIRLQQNQAQRENELKAKAAEARAKEVAAVPPSTRGEAWSVTSGNHFAPAGTPKGHVLAYLRAHPGSTTRQIMAAATSDSGIRAAIWRLHKDGVITK